MGDALLRDILLVPLLASIKVLDHDGYLPLLHRHVTPMQTLHLRSKIPIKGGAYPAEGAAHFPPHP